MRAPAFFALVVLFCSSVVRAIDADHSAPLPDLGPAPNFVLPSQDGSRFDLASQRGKVVLVTFIYTRCPEICPMLTVKMAHLQKDLGKAFGKDVAFVSITLDPERDTVEVLNDYAEALGADPTAQFGVLPFPGPDGTIDHNLLTTLIDRHGRLRTQYLGYRFDSAEMRRDLLFLMSRP